MTLRVHLTPTAGVPLPSALPRLLVHSVADAEGTTLETALGALASELAAGPGGPGGGGPGGGGGGGGGGAPAAVAGLRLLEPRDASGEPMRTTEDVFSVWLEHGDAANSGAFETDLHVWCRVEHAPRGSAAEEEAKDIYDLLASGE